MEAPGSPGGWGAPSPAGSPAPTPADAALHLRLQRGEPSRSAVLGWRERCWQADRMLVVSGKRCRDLQHF